jgi:hypothetical protein
MIMILGAGLSLGVAVADDAKDTTKKEKTGKVTPMVKTKAPRSQTKTKHGSYKKTTEEKK